MFSGFKLCRLLHLVTHRSGPINRTIAISTFPCFQKKTTYRSGYESETAEIQDTLRQYNLSENFSFDLDDLEAPTPTLSHAKPLRSVKDKSKTNRNFEFVDFRRVRVSGGKGGDGMICFLHLYSNPNAGPSGGDGGHGGHIIFEACEDVKSLNYVDGSYTGLPGVNGQHKDMHGENADHTYVKVPVGTLVKDAATGKLIADMNKEGIKFLAARGGCGGKGNHYFLSNENRHPRVAEVGANGEVQEFILELKMIAQAGLVGFPNAGKSTLLNAVSRAKPKVASYPFTTLKPSIGIVRYDDDEQLAIADLPGLIEDAHLNRGLGINFLRHIERCVCIFYVIDISSNEPYREFKVLLNELQHYKGDLSTRPSAIIINKMDVDRAEEKLHSFQQQLKQDNLDHLRVIPVSAMYGQNLTQLLVYFRELYDLYRFERFRDV